MQTQVADVMMVVVAILSPGGAPIGKTNKNKTTVGQVLNNHQPPPPTHTANAQKGTRNAALCIGAPAESLA